VLTVITRRALLLAIAVVASTRALGAQAPDSARKPPPAPIGRLVGVYDDDSGSPVGGAEVRLAGTNISVRTGSGGITALPRIADPLVLMQVRVFGYKPVVQMIDPRDTIPLTIVLKRVGQELPTVLVEAASTLKSRRLDEVVARVRASGAPMSSLITSEQLERRNAEVLSDRLPGRNSARGCTGQNMQLYVNGAKTSIPAPPGKPTPLDAFDWREIELIEVYRGAAQVPAQYNATGMPIVYTDARGRTTVITPDRVCVVLVWLK
jgi:hypothetical protein